MAKDAIDKEVGYSCSYVPLETLDSFGINATYVINDASSADTSQGYLSQNICGFAKDICSTPRDQAYDMIVTDCCDALIKLHEAFKLHPDFKNHFTSSSRYNGRNTPFGGGIRMNLPTERETHTVFPTFNRSIRIDFLSAKTRSDARVLMQPEIDQRFNILAASRDCLHDPNRFLRTKVVVCCQNR